MCTYRFPILIVLSVVCAALTLFVLSGTTSFDAAAKAAAVGTSTPITATEPISVPIYYEPRGVLIPLARIGGEIGALALDDGYAFVGQGLTVDVYQMSDGALRQVGRSQPMPGAVTQLELAIVDGRRLAVARFSGSGLAFLDLSDPRAPVVLATLPIPDWARFVFGSRTAGQGLGYLYYFPLDGGDFSAIDARDLMHPVNLGSVFQNYRTRDMAVVGTTAYLLSADSGYSFGCITVVDLADPIKPVRRGWLSLYDMRYESTLTAFERDGRRYAYTNAFVFDVTDPDVPVRLRSIEGVGYTPRWWVDGSHAYAIMGSQLVVYDVSDPAWPRLAASYPLFDGPITLAVQDAVALVGTSYGDLHLLDVTAPEVSSLVTSAGLERDYRDVAWQADRTLMINASGLKAYDAGGFDIVDLADQPRGPLPQSVLSGLARADGVAASEGRLYINNGGQQLIVGDVSREPVPTVLSRLATPDRFGGFAANDGWVYLTMGWQQIVLVFDVTDPTRLIMTGYAVGWDAKALAIQEWQGKRYLAVQEAYCSYPWDSQYSGVEISDISRGNPSAVRRYTVMACNLGVIGRPPAMRQFNWCGPGPNCNSGALGRPPAIAGNALYVRLNNGLNVFDMNAAVLEPLVVLPWEVAWLVGMENRLIVGQNGGWLVYDVADPIAPVLLATYLTDAWAGRPAFADGLAWVLDNNVVRVFDVSDFDRPEEVARYTVPGGAVGMTVSGRHAYLAGAAAGLWVLEYRPGAQWLPLMER